MAKSIWPLLIPLLAASTFAQSVRTEDLAAGKFLVANRKLADPNFAQSVVLLVQHDAKGTMGVIINRKSKLTLNKVFDDIKGASEAVFFGGPVELQAVTALIRADAKPRNALHVMGEIYLATRKSELDKLVATQPDARNFRAFIGYSGWGPGQLEAEMERGSWYIFPATVKTVFDANVTTVWERLISLTEQQLASVRPR